MRTATLSGSAALVALLMGLMPAPASAQLGGFLKKQIKQKIVHTVVDSAMSKVAGQASGAASDVNAARATDAIANANNAGTTASVNSVPSPSQLDKNMIEITPQTLDKLEKFLSMRHDQGKHGTTEIADAMAKSNGLTLVEYGMLTQRVVMFCAMAATPDSGGTAMRALAASSGLMKAYTPAEALALKPRCGRLAALLGS